MKKCVVCGRECKQIIKGMCQKHYRQFMKYGEVLDNIPRTQYDPNEIIEYEDYAEIVLYNKDCEEVARALIDLEDVDNVKEYKWHLNNSTGYVNNNKNKLLLHRFIMDCPKDKVVDHVNHDPLDNRKENLRVCTHQENIMNSSLSKNNTSGITGVAWDKQHNKWRSQIKINRKSITLGLFNTKEEAIEARKQAELEYFGEYRNKDE